MCTEVYTSIKRTSSKAQNVPMPDNYKNIRCNAQQHNEFPDNELCAVQPKYNHSLKLKNLNDVIKSL